MEELWIEVFRVGTWTSGEGKTRTWTLADLDRIVAATEPKLAAEGVPAVIGHPKTDAPAWGWVHAIKREGDRLVVRFRDLVPEFVEMVRQRRFTNRSIAVREDLSIQHIGFLGAVPPAVQGLAPIALSAAASLAVFEFPAHVAKEETRMTFMEKLKQFLGLAEELGIKVDAPPLAKPPVDPGAPKTFSEADVKAAAAQAAEAARTEERTKLGRAHARASLKTGIAAFCDGLKTKGHLLPAWEKAGLVTFMEQLGEIEVAVTFAAGADKQTPLAWFQEFLGGMPKLVEFREAADPAKKTPTVLSDTQRAINRQMGVADEIVTKFAASRN